MATYSRPSGSRTAGLTDCPGWLATERENFFLGNESMKQPSSERAFRPVAFLLLLLIAGTAVLWLLPRPATAFRLSVSFAGYTNNSSGAPVPAFIITNSSTIPVRRWDFCEIEEQQTSLKYEMHPGPDAYLSRGDAEILALPKITNQGPWRVTLYFTRDGWRRRFIRNRSRWWSWAVPNRFIPNEPVEHHITSDWLTQ
jgi:hypothetical protein